MITLRSIDTTREIRASADAWDDLWRRSGACLPTKRAAMLAQWVDHFAQNGPFTVIVVEDAGRMLAALPLIVGKIGNLLPVGKLPINCWSSAGDLLIDPSCDMQGVLGLLVEGIRQLPWPLLWLDTIEIDEPRWRAFQAACREGGLPTECHPQFDLGLIDTEHDWNDYQARWSKNLRRDMRRRLRMAEEQGALRLEVHANLASGDVERLLTSGLEVEDRSWKGPAGTSVLRSPGAYPFFLEQAEQLAEWGQLRLSFLRLNDWPIAFEYGYEAEGVHFSHKAGYDEAYRDVAPGQLLMMMLLERSHDNSAICLHNCMGMLTQAIAKWCTRTQPIGRLVVGTGGTLGKACMLSYCLAGPLARRLRRRNSKDEDTPPRFQPGCARKTGNAVPEPAGA